MTILVPTSQQVGVVGSSTNGSSSIRCLIADDYEGYIAKDEASLYGLDWVRKRESAPDRLQLLTGLRLVFHEQQSDGPGDLLPSADRALCACALAQQLTVT